MSQFAFLQREWPSEFESCGKAEAAVHADPRTACFLIGELDQSVGPLGTDAAAESSKMGDLRGFLDKDV